MERCWKEMLDVLYEEFDMMAMRWVVVSTVCDCVKADDADAKDSMNAGLVSDAPETASMLAL